MICLRCGKMLQVDREAEREGLGPCLCKGPYPATVTGRTPTDPAVQRMPLTKGGGR